jgi:hypothetical protein
VTTPNPPYTSDAVSREAAWLRTSGDGLPAMLSANGGPFEVVQGYWPGAKLRTQATGLYVQRTRLTDPRAANLRLRPSIAFLLKVVWPVRATQSGIAETEAQNLDNAIELLRQRIAGPPLDKTHGGRFLSVAEAPREQAVVVDFDDPEVTIPQQKALRARVVYYADDLEING